MSKIGRQAITIPSDATVSVAGSTITVKGKLATFTREIPETLSIEIKDGVLQVIPKDAEDRLSRISWGTMRALIANDIEGATKGFTKKLEIDGVGYNAKLQGKVLVLVMGFSHPVNMDIPEGLTVEVKKNVVTITGASKEVVGQFAANVRAIKKPEPYKGKGIHYEGEHIRRKEGKKAAAEGAK